MVMMESIECGVRQKRGRCSSGEMMHSSPVSTSYGGSAPLQRDNVIRRAELERKWKSDKYGQSRLRLNASKENQMNFERTRAQDSGLSGNGNVEERSANLKQGRKQHNVRQSLASKVCLKQMSSGSVRDECEVSGDENEDNLLHSKTFERLVQLSELEEEVLLLHKRLAEELELRTVLESALENSSVTLINFPRHLPISAQELLANITLLEVAVLKLEEQSLALQNEVGQARIEREIAELRLSSLKSAPFKLKGSALHLSTSGPKGTFRDDYTISSSGAEPESDGQHLEAVATPTLLVTTAQQSCTSLGCPALGQESELGRQSLSSWKEQQALTLRKDLRLTTPDFPDADDATLLSSRLHHEYDSISDTQSQGLNPFWKQNPLEEEEYWIPLYEHHPEAMFAEVYYESPQDCSVDPYLEPVGYIGRDEETPCFSPAIIAETLRAQSPDLADLAEDDDKSFLPVAEVLWKPPTVMPFLSLKDIGNEIPTVPVLSIKPESWSFTSEDDHPRPESGYVPRNMIFEDRPWAQLAESASLEEQKTKYRIGVMNFREQRRHGLLEKNCDKAKSLGPSRTSSISSAKSGVLLSPTWSRVDAETVKEDGYKSGESVEMENDHGFVSSFKSPNELSEEMVQCMMSIYRHLADSNNVTEESSSLYSTQSPSSPGTTNLSAISPSESSLLSITRSPLVDLRSKEVLGNDASPDPFKARGKIQWADIGPYAHVLEVSWLTVGKDQLDFAAQALRNFKILVEQLSKVDPANLKHEEKLAFWINLYNALLMHAYLAYGIPRNDLKFFSLLQKAAYTVGGHSFNAATMEYCLLRSKSTTHRPQLTLLMSLHKYKLTEDQSKFAIDHPESLVSFGLCSGTRSSPMVRVYTAKHVKSQLEDALHDYTRAAVGISTKGRLLVPKLLYTHAREFVEDSGLLDWICNRLPSNQVAVVFECIQQRRHRFLGSKNFNVLPNDYTFRYIFPAEVSS